MKLPALLIFSFICVIAYGVSQQGTMILLYPATWIAVGASFWGLATVVSKRAAAASSADGSSTKGEASRSESGSDEPIAKTPAVTG